MAIRFTNQERNALQRIILKLQAERDRIVRDIGDMQEEIADTNRKIESARVAEFVERWPSGT